MNVVVLVSVPVYAKWARDGDHWSTVGCTHVNWAVVRSCVGHGFDCGVCVPTVHGWCAYHVVVVDWLLDYYWVMFMVVVHVLANNCWSFFDDNGRLSPDPVVSMRMRMGFCVSFRMRMRILVVSEGSNNGHRPR